MAPEMMPPFYQEWIYPWLPMRFMIEELRRIFFFGEGLTWNFDVSALVWIGIVSMIIIVSTTMKHNSEIAENTEQKTAA